MTDMTEPYAYIEDEIERLRCAENEAYGKIEQLTTIANTHQKDRMYLEDALDRQKKADSDREKQPGKIYVRTDYDGCEYITAGKIYEATVIEECPSDALLSLVDDEGDTISTRVVTSVHLDDYAWEIVDKQPKR